MLCAWVRNGTTSITTVGEYSSIIAADIFTAIVVAVVSWVSHVCYSHEKSPTRRTNRAFRFRLMGRAHH